MMDQSDVIDEWFGPLDAQGGVAQEKVSAWWKKSPEFDAYLKTRFGALIEQALQAGLDWPSPKGALAEIILLDQFARNTYRDTAKMYAGDARAQGISRALLDSGVETLPGVMQIFVFMPLMHSETLADQDACIQCFERLIQEAPSGLDDLLTQSLKYAQAHRDIVARFGRFPHRNAILGRPTTADEEEFLKQPGSSF